MDAPDPDEVTDEFLVLYLELVGVAACAGRIDEEEDEDPYVVEAVARGLLA